MKALLANTFHVNKPIIGMIHLSGYTPEQAKEWAKWEIEQLYECGVDAVLVEDYFGDAEEVEWTLEYLHKQYKGNIYGVNMLSDNERAFRLAVKYGASFIQMDSVCGHLRPGRNPEGQKKAWIHDIRYDEDYAEKLAALREQYPVFLLGGVRFKYQPVYSGRTVEEDLMIGKERCNAVVVTGSGTGISTEMEKIRQFRSVLGDFPLIVGAGMTEATCQEQLALADGAIVGSWFKKDGVTEYPVDPERVRRFMEIAKANR